VGPRKNMCGFSRDGSTIHKTRAIAVVILYVLVVSAVDLFHDDECTLAPSGTAPADLISSSYQCPACMFLAGHSSTGVGYGPALSMAERLIIPQFSPRVTFVLNNEWGHSIISRAPPSAVIS
jgi:hypothetical protein